MMESDLALKSLGKCRIQILTTLQQHKRV
uniref:Uncharacterized protein n=1 Tax=Lepeophtheirus salmonis TaxID=72036 RepID=A0A0K2VLA4_LEPSM